MMRCVDAMRNSGVARSLEVVGIVDRDYHSDNFLAAMPPSVHALECHEVESLIATPAVVEAAARHIGCAFDSMLSQRASCRRSARASATQSSYDGGKHALSLSRWPRGGDGKTECFSRRADRRDSRSFRYGELVLASAVP